MGGRGSGSNGACRILPPFPAVSPPPFSPHSSKIASTGPRRPNADWETYRGVGGFKQGVGKDRIGLSVPSKCALVCNLRALLGHNASRCSQENDVGAMEVLCSAVAYFLYVSVKIALECTLCSHYYLNYKVLLFKIRKTYALFVPLQLLLSIHCVIKPFPVFLLHLHLSIHSAPNSAKPNHDQVPQKPGKESVVTNSSLCILLRM